jgi:hypothetical protein
MYEYYLVVGGGGGHTLNLQPTNAPRQVRKTIRQLNQDESWPPFRVYS